MQKTNSQVLKYIDPSQILNVISSEQKQSITCSICLGVVLEPAECKTCQTIYCSHQVMSKGAYQPCPICKSLSWRFGSDIHRVYKSRLSSLQVKCDLHPECKDLKYTYQKYLAHMSNDKLQKPIQHGYYQLYYQIDGKWQPFEGIYNDVANLFIGQNYSEFNLGKYQINIKELKQRNTITKRIRIIKLELVKDRVAKPVWTVQTERSKYEPYDQDANTQIEKAYQQFLKGKRKDTTIKAGKYFYQIQFTTLKQINSVSRTSRKVKRSVV